MVKSSLPNSIKIISDLDKSFEEYDKLDLIVSEKDIHPSALAHKLIAERIYSEIIDRDFLLNNKKCSS